MRPGDRPAVERRSLARACVSTGRSGDHAGADMLGELNGKAGNPAGSALDQDRLPALELQCVLDCAQGGKTGQGHGRCLYMGDAGGFLRDVDGNLLRIGTLLPGFADGEDLIADAKVIDARADCANHAGKITPQDIGKLHLPVAAAASRNYPVFRPP